MYVCTYVGPLLLYKSGTTNGSSGSPVLKEVNGVLVPVALHRGGNSNAQPYRGCNFGTLISEILKCLSGQPYSSCMCSICALVCVCMSVCCMCVCLCLCLCVLVCVMRACLTVCVCCVCVFFYSFNTFLQYPLYKRSKQY